MPAVNDQHPDIALLSHVHESMRLWSRESGLTWPTSQITGGGAVGVVEQQFGQLHGGRSALLLPSATYAMRLALQVVGVRSGDSVLIPAVDWPATRAATLSLGAKPVAVAVDRHTLTIDSEAARSALTPSTSAVVACHLHGVAADVSALRDAVRGIPVIEDCAQALGSTLDDASVGTLGDAAVFSFGPGKQIDAGEAGMLLLNEPSMIEAAARKACHPVRQLLSGIVDPEPDGFSIRPHPVAALLAWYGLRTWDPQSVRRSTDAARSIVRQWPGAELLGDDERRTSLYPSVPVRLAGDRPPGDVTVSLRRTGARFLGNQSHMEMARTLAQTWLVAWVDPLHGSKQRTNTGSRRVQDTVASRIGE